jgi:peroxiredoxin
MKQLPTGALAPDFTLRTAEGKSLRLSEAIVRSPVVLAFYKADCPTCQLTFPYLQRIHSEFREGSKLRIWGISQDDVAETKAFVQQYGIGFDILIDEHPYAVSMAYQLEFVPTLFVVGSDGKIQLSDYGFSKATLSEIGKPLQLFSPDDGLPATRPG